MVFRGKRRKRDYGVGKADALARRQLAADQYLGHRAGACGLGRDEADLAVVEQQRTAGLQRREDFRMRQVNARLVARRFA